MRPTKPFDRATAKPGDILGWDNPTNTMRFSFVGFDRNDNVVVERLDDGSFCFRRYNPHSGLYHYDDRRASTGLMRRDYRTSPDPRIVALERRK